MKITQRGFKGDTECSIRNRGLSFAVLAGNGSFSKAAERLCKTTATINYRIKLLEEERRVALFSHDSQRSVGGGWRASLCQARTG